MAIDTPARLAILGAGPIGLEAALYARFLGYEVAIYERGEIADAVRRVGHVPLLVPFASCRTTLGLAALQAQDENYAPPDEDAMLTAGQWRERYLLPLAQTDLLADHLRLHTTAVAVGKEELRKADLPGHEDRGDWSFRVLSRNAAGEERMDLFDGVLDCSGVAATPNWLGHGGIPAIGEVAQRDAIEYGFPDVLGNERARYAGKQTLLIGAGLSAAVNATALATLAANEPGTRATWITRREGKAAAGPIAVLPNDPLPARAAIVREANALAVAGPPITYWPRTFVERIGRAAGGGFEVQLSGEHAGTIVVDQIIASVGHRPDERLTAELQLAWCPQTQMPLVDGSAHSAHDSAASAVGRSTANVVAEPNYYVLGRKRCGRQAGFTVAEGYGQIRDAFRRIGDRAGLDLYAGAKPLLR